MSYSLRQSVAEHIRSIAAGKVKGAAELLCNSGAAKKAADAWSSVQVKGFRPPKNAASIPPKPVEVQQIVETIVPPGAGKDSDSTPRAGSLHTSFKERKDDATHLSSKFELQGGAITTKIRSTPGNSPPQASIKCPII